MAIISGVDKNSNRVKNPRAFGGSVLILLMPLVVFGGCSGDGIERVPLSGKVTFEGQPIAEGQIRFVPKAGVAAPLVVESIKNGRYETATTGGLPVGAFRVEIVAWNPDQPPPSGPGMPSRTQLLPEKYNTRSTLDITIESGQKATTHDFKLTP